MTTFIIIVCVIAVIIFANSQSKNPTNTQPQQRKNNQDNTPYRKRAETPEVNPIPTLAALVKSVNTIEEFEAFEKKYDEISTLHSQDFDNKYNERLYRRYESAFADISNKLSDKIFYYQYIPDIDLDSKLEEVLNAYKVFTPEEYKVKKKKTEEGDWNEITGNELMGGTKLENVVAKKPNYYDALVEFRQIVESKITASEKYTKLSHLISNNFNFKIFYASTDKDVERIATHYSNTKEKTSP